MALSSISSFVDSVILSIFPAVSTHLKHTEDQSLTSQLFPNDCILTAISIVFNRYTVKYEHESKVSRVFWSALLGYFAFHNYDYWILFSLHALSFAQYIYNKLHKYFVTGHAKNTTHATAIVQHLLLMIAFISAYIFVIYTIFSIAQPQNNHAIFQTDLYALMKQSSSSLLSSPGISFPFQQLMKLHSKLMMKSSISIGSLLPIQEMKDAYNILIEFVNPSTLHAKMAFLLFITFHVQTGIGYLGIEFLTNEQNRKNALIRIEDTIKNKKNKKKNKASMSLKGKGKGNNSKNSNNNQKDKNENEKDASKQFRESAGPFIFFVALPYMAQIVFFGALNMYAFHCFRDDIHRIVRLGDLFDNGGQRFVATASNASSSLTPRDYAQNAEKVVTTVYDLFNQNMFSLPKLMLLPRVIAKQPMLLIKITPLILLSDFIKSRIVSTITTEYEKINKEIKNVEALRSRIEEYDLKNSELIQRSGYDSIAFTEARWVDLTENIQDLHARASIMNRSKLYFSWVQRNFVMMALVDCALAKLIAVGKIVSSDIFVYARAIEDFIGFILMRSRAESELASMASSIQVLKDLKQVWNDSEDRNLLNCSVNNDESVDKSFIGENNSIDIKGLSYSRGSAYVEIDHVNLPAGIYAVTGANGSGKSTLFRILMGCDTNRKSIDMDESIVIKSTGSLNMPSRNVVEISQNFYWPLKTAPADWIYHTHIESISEKEKEDKIARLAKELQTLKFYPDTQPGSDLAVDLTTVKDDWFSDLSGGQKSKVELVRKVFLEDHCPEVLLIDETFAPLDPDSKSLVMQSLKDFCLNSVVLVIYHADVQISEDENEIDNDDNVCVPSSNFFDNNLHVENGILSLRSVC